MKLQTTNIFLTGPELYCWVIAISSEGGGKSVLADGYSTQQHTTWYVGLLYLVIVC